MLSLPEEKIDVGVAALTFAKEIYPLIDIPTYSLQIDAIAEGARQTIARYGRNDPESIIRAMNTYFYKEYGVRYDKSPGARAKQENYFINGILDSKQGQCITIPMLYMAVAQRLGYPVYPVIAPEHTFVRFVNSSLKEQNIELSSGAGYSTDEDYAYKLNINPKAIRAGAYLRTLTYREFLATLLQQNALVFASRGNLDKAIRYFEKAQRIDSRNPYFPKNLAGLWASKAKLASSPEATQAFRLKSYRYFQRAEDLGWTHDPDANTRSNK